MMYYSRKKVMSYPADFKFICGGKDIGKSYQFKEYLIHQYLTKHHKFLFIVRFENELEGSLNKVKTYFNDIKLEHKYPDFSISYRNGIFYLYNKITKKFEEIGMVGILNKLAKQTGSISAENVYTILFEEFQNIDGKYLKDEVDKFLILYNSIARSENCPARKVKAIFLSNAFSISNPYFQYFNIDKMLKIGTKFLNLKSKNIIVEMAEASQVVDKIKESDFYKLIKGSRFEDFSLNNKFYLDNNIILKKLSPKDSPLCKIKYNNKIFIIYDNKKYLIVSDREKKLEEMPLFTITEKDFTPDTMKLEAFKKTYYYKYIKDAFINSRLYYTNQRSYKAILFLFSINE